MNHVSKSFLLFLFLIAVNCFQELAGCQLVNQKPLQIVLALSKNAKGLYKKPNATDDPVYMAVASALLSKEVIIVSPTILHWLSQRTVEGRDGVVSWLQRLEGNYIAYLAKNNGFVLLVPKDKASMVTSFGFNKEALNEPMISTATMKRCFADKAFEEQEIAIEHLASIFVNDSSAGQVFPKFWYVVGHGLDSIDDRQFEWSKALVAQLELYQVVQLLQLFNEINSRGVYLVSCYDAGKNVLKLQNLLSGRCIDERCPLKKDLTFPLFMQGTTDMPTSLVFGHYCSFPDLATVLEEWSQENFHKYDDFIQQFGGLYAEVPKDDRFFNYPILRLPGKESRFKAVPLPTVVVIDLPVSASKTIDIDGTVDTVQLYPAGLDKVTIHMLEAQLPGFVSRVAGVGQHFLGTLEIDATGDLLSILTNCFLTGMATDDGDLCAGIADKCWFISEVHVAGKKIAKGVVVHKGSLKHGSIVLTIVYQDEQGCFNRIIRTVETAEKHVITNEQLNQDAYIKAVQRMYWETLPSVDAVAEAMGDQETIEDHQRLLKQFGQSMNISLMPADESSLIQEDFANIRSTKINKNIYINYAAYTGNCAIITAMIDSALSGNTFDADDIMYLLQHLIDHEQASLVVESIKRLATLDDPSMLTCVLYVFSYLLDQSLHAHAMTAYDDIIICTRQIMKLALSAKQNRRLLSLIQNDLTRLMVMLMQKNQSEIAVEKVLALLSAHELGLQGFGLVVIESMQAAGFTNAGLEAKKDLLTAIAMRLEAAVHEGNIVAAYFSQQAMVKTYAHCLTA